MNNVGDYLPFDGELIDGNRSREVLTRILQTMSLGEVALGYFLVPSGYLVIKSFLRRTTPGFSPGLV